jgi:hypothetical protein
MEQSFSGRIGDYLTSPNTYVAAFLVLLGPVLLWVSLNCAWAYYTLSRHGVAAEAQWIGCIESDHRHHDGEKRGDLTGFHPIRGIEALEVPYAPIGDYVHYSFKTPVGQMVKGWSGFRQPCELGPRDKVSVLYLPDEPTANTGDLRSLAIGMCFSLIGVLIAGAVGLWLYLTRTFAMTTSEWADIYLGIPPKL